MDQFSLTEMELSDVFSRLDLGIPTFRPLDSRVVVSPGSEGAVPGSTIFDSRTGRPIADSSTSVPNPSVVKLGKRRREVSGHSSEGEGQGGDGEDKDDEEDEDDDDDDDEKDDEDPVDEEEEEQLPKKVPAPSAKAKGKRPMHRPSAVRRPPLFLPSSSPEPGPEPSQPPLPSPAAPMPSTSTEPTYTREQLLETVSVGKSLFPFFPLSR